MTHEEIKKELYKKNPKAHFVYFLKGKMLYAASIDP